MNFKESTKFGQSPNVEGICSPPSIESKGGGEVDQSKRRFIKRALGVAGTLVFPGCGGTFAKAWEEAGAQIEREDLGIDYYPSAKIEEIPWQYIPQENLTIFFDRAGDGFYALNSTAIESNTIAEQLRRAGIKLPNSITDREIGQRMEVGSLCNGIGINSPFEVNTSYALTSGHCNCSNAILRKDLAVLRLNYNPKLPTVDWETTNQELDKEKVTIYGTLGGRYFRVSGTAFHMKGGKGMYIPTEAFHEGNCYIAQENEPGYFLVTIHNYHGTLRDTSQFFGGLSGSPVYRETPYTNERTLVGTLSSIYVNGHEDKAYLVFSGPENIRDMLSKAARPPLP